MALYAHDADDVVPAWDAKPNGRYWCLECSQPVKMRRGRSRIPHFYHLKLSPSCRLYSKSEDHLLIQLQIEKLLPKGETEIERIFQPIHRVSDIVWEKEKIAFEIQCSPIYPKEVRRRIEEYRTIGYTVVWILDDRLYNKKILRPSEEFMRRHLGYFVSFSRHTPSIFYDQFEIFSSHRRIKKSGKLLITLERPARFPSIGHPPDWPKQILQRSASGKPYFQGDLLYRALQASVQLCFASSIRAWADLEKQLGEEEWKRRFFERVKLPALEWLNGVLAKRG